MSECPDCKKPKRCNALRCLRCSSEFKIKKRQQELANKVRATFKCEQCKEEFFMSQTKQRFCGESCRKINKNLCSNNKWINKVPRDMSNVPNQQFSPNGANSKRFEQMIMDF